jgi:hypothetical protein
MNIRMYLIILYNAPPSAVRLCIYVINDMEHNALSANRRVQGMGIR